MGKHETIALPTMHRSAAVRAASFREDDNSIEVVWTAGARVRRFSWIEGEFDEELEVSAKAVRLDRLNAGAPLLDTHDASSLAAVIGSVIPGSAKIVGGKGIARVQLSDAPADGDIVAKIKAGVIRNVSVGYRIHRVEKIEDDSAVPLHRVVDWEPMELSAVPIPADPHAQVRAEGAQTYPATIVNRSKQEAKMPNKNVIPASDDAATAELERARCGAISDLGQRFGVADLATAAIRDGIDLADFRRSVIDKLADDERRNHPGGPGNQIGAYANVRDDMREQARALAMENALLHRVDPNTFRLEGDGRDFVGLPLIELARSSLEARGVRTSSMSKMQLAAEALGQRSGFHSTSDFPIVLGNVVNRTLRNAYETAPQTFRPLVRVTTVPDFREVTRAQMSEAPQFEKVNEHGEFKSGTMSDAGEKYRVETYGRIIGITRQAIINDDLGAFTRLPRAFGQQAAQLESDLAWAEIMRNAAMADGKALFHADHKNVLTAGAISETTVSEARLKMSMQADLDQRTLLNLSPEHIIVPKALQTAAEKFIAQLHPTKEADAVSEQLRRLSIISEPRLDAGIARYGIAGDAAAYYFAASTAQIDLIELAYLEGAQGVYSETRQGFEVDGIEVKVRMDVAAKALDWRGFSKNAGA